MNKTSLSDQSQVYSLKHIDLSVKKIAIDLEIAAILLAILSVAGQSLKYLTNYEEAFGLIPLVNMAKALSIRQFSLFLSRLSPQSCWVSSLPLNILKKTAIAAMAGTINFFLVDRIR